MTYKPVVRQKHLLVCEMCGNKFETYYADKKTCSEKCKQNRYEKLTGRFVEENRNSGLSTGTVGAMSELLVSSDLLRKGYAVFRSVSPACFCDLIAIKEKKMLKMEVRTAYKSRETDNLLYTKRLHGEVDCFGLHERNSGAIYYRDLKGNKFRIMKTRLPMYETPLDPLTLTSAGTRVSDFTPNTPEQAEEFPPSNAKV